MNKKYTVQMSDRKRCRHIDAGAPDEAVRQALGDRCINIRLAERMVNRLDIVVQLTYEAMIRTGPTRHGSTPFKNVRVWVSV